MTYLRLRAQVYLAAIVGYVPDKMVQCLSSFVEMCYIFRRNAITATALARAEVELQRFHELREVFVEEGVRTSCSLPRQHALVHFLPAIPSFGSPNGLCSSITESKHITAVKEPWRRSSRFEALAQMLKIIVRLDKMGALRRVLAQAGMLRGNVAAYTAAMFTGSEVNEGSGGEESDDEGTGPGSVAENVDERMEDTEPDAGPRLASSVLMAKTIGETFTPTRLAFIS